MNYASIRDNDIANGEGVRVSLFVSGCDFRCPGCFNQEAQDFAYGQEFTPDVMNKLATMVAEPTISGLSILGGDPLCQGIDGLIYLVETCKYVHQLGKTVWLWTGFEWEQIFDPYLDSGHIHIWRQLLLSVCDVVIDGPFEQELADRKLVWRGSANQRVIDAQASLKTGHVVTYQRGVE